MPLNIQTFYVIPTEVIDIIILIIVDTLKLLILYYWL